MPSTSESAEYTLVNRLAALRALLRRGDLDKAQIKRRLPGWYPPEASAAANDRRFRRDVKALRALGDQIKYDHLTQTYHLESPAHLDLTDDDVDTLAVIRESFEAAGPKADEAHELLEKIVQALPEAQGERFYRKPPLAVNLKPAADYRPHYATLRALEKSITRKQLIRFRYQSLDGSEPGVHRRVEPYELQFFDRHFYLVGYSSEADNVVEFRVDRIAELEPLPTRVGARKRRRTVRFKYRLGNRIARLGVSERFLNQRVSHWQDGDAYVDAEGYSDFRILQDLLRYGEQAELLEPLDLRAKMRAVVRQMWGMYE